MVCITIEGVLDWGKKKHHTVKVNDKMYEIDI